MPGIIRRTLVLLCASALFLFPAAAQQPVEGEWARQFQSPGLDHYVYAIDVAGEDVYFGGAFNWANGQQVNRIARWDGQNWHPVGDGVSDSVFAIAAAPDGSIYAGGAFTHAGGEAVGYVARWDGSSWSSLGGGMDATVKALAVDAAGNVYAGGRFQSAGGVAANHVARWNGTEWEALRGGVDGPVNALILDDAGALIAGGDFQIADGIAAGLVAKWNDGQWESFDGGLDHRGEPVLALAIEDDNLYVGGGQFIANGRLLGFIAKWTGDAWVDVAFPWGSPVYSLAAGSNGRLYAGTSNGTIYVGIEDGWNRLEGRRGGFWGTVRVLRFDVGRLFMGGDNRRGDTFRVSVWSEEGGHSALLGNSPDHLGLSSWAYTLSVAENGDVYSGGSFLYAGGTRVNNIARWDGDRWSALDDGVNGVVDATAFDSAGNLYVAGLFSRAGDVEAHNIARWDGESWSPLASGLDGRVNTIFFDEYGTLYAGGSFGRAGASQAGGVAEWDGLEWTAIGAGFDNAVTSLTFHGGALYAGLRAEEDRGNLVRCDSGCFARWDGESWSTVGEGLYSMGRVYEVHSLVSYGERLLVAGVMSDITIRKTRVNGLVAWDGTTFSAFTRPRIDTPALSHIHALILRDDHRLYAAAGGVFIWDGEGWTPIEGAPSGARGMAFHENNVYFGGSFSHAGGRRSSHFASYREPRDAMPIEKNPGAHGLRLAQSFPNPFQRVTTIAFTLPTHAHASLTVYDLLGRVVSKPIDGMLAAGSHSVTVEGTNLPNGTYYYRLQSEDMSRTRQFVVVK